MQDIYHKQYLLKTILTILRTDALHSLGKAHELTSYPEGPCTPHLGTLVPGRDFGARVLKQGVYGSLLAKRPYRARGPTRPKTISFRSPSKVYGPYTFGALGLDIGTLPSYSMKARSEDSARAPDSSAGRRSSQSLEMQLLALGGGRLRLFTYV